MYTDEFKRLLNQTKPGSIIDSRTARIEGKEKNYVTPTQLRQFAIHAKKDLDSNNVFGRQDIYPWNIISNLSDKSLFYFVMIYDKLFDSNFILELRDSNFSDRAKSKDVILVRVDNLYSSGRWDSLYSEYKNPKK